MNKTEIVNIGRKMEDLEFRQMVQEAHRAWREKEPEPFSRALLFLFSHVRNVFEDSLVRTLLRGHSREPEVFFALEQLRSSEKIGE